MPTELPAILTRRYHGERFISRMPFLFNKALDHEETITTDLPFHAPRPNDVYIGSPVSKR